MNYEFFSCIVLLDGTSNKAKKIQLIAYSNGNAWVHMNRGRRRGSFWASLDTEVLREANPNEETE
jgi:hypothetical protein